MSNDVVLEVKGVSKSFPGVKALTDISLDIRKGEVHAVVGENGAGKSTLMKILTGVYSKDEGEYFIEGQPVELKSVQHSIGLGISCIYQELTIVPLLDVAQNIFLGHTPLKKGKIIDRNRMYREAKEILNKLEMDISVKTLAKDLSIAQQQMLEIGRAISTDSKVIIMDEPSSSLTQKETDILFKVIRTLTIQGIAIIYISHKLEEVMEISDRATVFRDGQKIITMKKDETNKEIIVKHMIGRTIENYFNKVKAEIGDTVLEVKGLTRKDVFNDISFVARKGEVLGFFGLVGAGRSEIMRAIFGIDKYESGEIKIDNHKVKIKDSIQAIKAGLGLVPEDRKLEGLVLKMDVQNNSTLVKMNEINKYGVIIKEKDIEFANKYVDYLNIKTPSIKKLTGELSGGNQQKVVISKWLMINPKVLILDEPTRGIDVAAKAEIYRLISELAGKGVAIIVVSSELPEILGICDRIITVYDGRITGEMNAEDINSNKVMQAALGGIDR